jgi:hypothetical protein
MVFRGQKNCVRFGPISDIAALGRAGQALDDRFGRVNEGADSETSGHDADTGAPMDFRFQGYTGP